MGNDHGKGIKSLVRIEKRIDRLSRIKWNKVAQLNRIKWDKNCEMNQLDELDKLAS